MSTIRYIDDKDGNHVFPVTHERAVRDSEGVTLETKLGQKQNTIQDISTIRSGAAAGATAVQPAALNAKQDTIADLTTIRSGAALGSTSVQPVDIENMVEAEPIGSIIPPVNPSEFATTEEVSQLRQEVTGLEDKAETTLVHSKNLADYVSVLDGLYPNGNGILTANANSKSIKFPCKPSTTYTISKVVTRRFRVAYYNTDPVLSTPGAGTISNNTASAITITTAADSSYIVAYVYDGSVETLTMDEILASLQIEEGSAATPYETPGWTAVDKIVRENVADIGGRMETMSNSISNNSDDIEELREILTSTINGIETSDIITGEYRDSAGGISTLNGYFYSTPIKLHEGDRIATDVAIPTTASVSYITQVNEDGDFIAVLYSGTGNEELIDYTIQRDGYYSISAYGTRRKNFSIYRNGIEKRLDDLAVDVASVSPAADTKLPAITDNPLSSVRRDAGYGMIIKTWGFIGDSYTSGETPAYNGSTIEYLDCYKWSWGQQFMRIIGSQGYNFSNGGQTAKGWIRNQGTVHDDSYYGGAGGGDWMQAQTDLKQGYIISLGINDNGKFGTTYLGATYSLGDVPTDVNVSDYTQNDENTFAGCYAGIIQRILSVQPRAKIFCITQFQDTLEQVNDVVRDIVDLFPNNVFLVDLHDYAYNIVNQQYYMKNGHPSAFGYAYMAYCINTYIDYIIRKHPDKFMDVTLIGSDYTLNPA